MTHWIAVERRDAQALVWVVDGDGTVVADTCLEQTGLAAIIAWAAAWISGETRIVMCGPAPGQAPRVVKVPCPPPLITQAAPSDDPRFWIEVLPAIGQDRPADMMQGDGARVAGVLAERPKFDGVICLPGIQSTWVHVSAGEIVSFRSFITGELFAGLGAGVPIQGLDAEAVQAGVRDGMARPQLLTSDVVGLRAEALLQGQPFDAARLLGLLIGVELTGARPYWLGQPLIIAGDPAVAQVYADALAAQGAMADCLDGAAMALLGLKAAHAESSGETPGAGDVH